MKRLLLLGLILAGCTQAPPQGAPVVTVGMSAQEARARIAAADPPFAAVAIRSQNVPPNNTDNIVTDVTTVYARNGPGVIKVREVDYVVVEVDYNPVAKVPSSISQY
jgi:hypothetical protein